MKRTISNNNQEKSIKIINKTRSVLFPVMMVLITGTLMTVIATTESKVFAQEETTNTTMMRDNFTKNFNDSLIQNTTLSVFAQEDTLLPSMQSLTLMQINNIIDISAGNDTKNYDDKIITQQSSTLTQNIQLQFEPESNDGNSLEETS
ncbi:MAG: hypothetical protein ACPKPY_03130 [Nitrososphaeraceae archaeon]